MEQLTYNKLWYYFFGASISPDILRIEYTHEFLESPTNWPDGWNTAHNRPVVTNFMTSLEDLGKFYYANKCLD